MELPSNNKCHFFIKHVDILCIAPLPKIKGAQAWRISSHHERAWLSKLLVVELHSGDMTRSSPRETCRKILGCLFGKGTDDVDCDQDIASSLELQNGEESTGTRAIVISKNCSMSFSFDRLMPLWTIHKSWPMRNADCWLIKFFGVLRLKRIVSATTQSEVTD